ncbi:MULTISPECIES: hypothetical protein [unclassified Streptomyces]|uniref:hypothetical protein n=1 Tax=unclassified Streptomyces TaxID=2593676 RepID=UPI00114C8E74|nr:MULTISPECIES: hypothetical protein [unclassified Streptomyces]MYS20904.1 hypothetical protein [Streptomyces sp. SID4948]
MRAELLVRLLTGEFPVPPGARPALKVVGAHISGTFDLEGLAVAAPIRLDQSLFDEAPVLTDAECASIRLPGCQVPGFKGAGLRTQGNLELDQGFVCVGLLDLSGAEIGGDLKLRDALIHNPGERAIFASRISVSKALLAGRLVVVGQTRLLSGRISGLFSLSDAQLLNGGGIALQGERLEVGESLFFQRTFRAEGHVTLRNASINGGIDAREATFSSPPGTNCLNLVWMRTGRNASFKLARFSGNVAGQSASIGGSLNLNDTTFAAGSKLVLDRLKAGRVQLLPITPPRSVSLRQAKVGGFEDDPRTWPEELNLDNFEYLSLDSALPVSPQDRLRWLALDRGGYRPQPYQQLAAAYRVKGEEQQARRVALEGQRRRRRTLNPPGRLLGYLLDITVGYGYRTWIAGIWLTLFATAGSVVFTLWPAHATVKGAPAFHPFIYTLSLLLPIVDLGQNDTWQPQGFTQWFAWALTLLGWALTTAVVAGVSRVLNRST